MSTRAYQHFGKLDEGRRSTDFGEACSRISRDVWRTNTVWPELVEALNDCAVPVFVCTGRLWVGDVSASDRNRMAETRRAKRVGGRGSVRSTRAGRRQRRRVPEKNNGLDHARTEAGSVLLLPQQVSPVGAAP